MLSFGNKRRWSATGIELNSGRVRSWLGQISKRCHRDEEGKGSLLDKGGGWCSCLIGGKREVQKTHPEVCWVSWQGKKQCWKKKKWEMFESSVAKGQQGLLVKDHWAKFTIPFDICTFTIPLEIFKITVIKIHIYVCKGKRQKAWDHYISKNKLHQHQHQHKTMILIVLQWWSHCVHNSRSHLLWQLHCFGPNPVICRAGHRQSCKMSILLHGAKPSDQFLPQEKQATHDNFGT